MKKVFFKMLTVAVVTGSAFIANGQSALQKASLDTTGQTTVTLKVNGDANNKDLKDYEVAVNNVRDKGDGVYKCFWDGIKFTLTYKGSNCTFTAENITDPAKLLAATGTLSVTINLTPTEVEGAADLNRPFLVNVYDNRNVAYTNKPLTVSLVDLKNGNGMTGYLREANAVLSDVKIISNTETPHVTAIATPAPTLMSIIETGKGTLRYLTNITPASLTAAANETAITDRTITNAQVTNDFDSEFANTANYTNIALKEGSPDTWTATMEVGNISGMDVELQALNGQVQVLIPLNVAATAV